jgi:hypothetical protein
MQSGELFSMVIGAVLLGAGVLLRGYLSEKGKNIATQEDIAKITRAVEEVRGEIQSLRDSQSRIRTTRQEASLAFAEPCLELFLQRLPCNPGDFPMDGGKSMFEHQTAMLGACTKIQLAYFRLEVFLPNGHPLVLSALKVAGAAPDLERAIRKYFGPVRLALAEEEQLLKQGRDSGPYLQKAIEVSNAAAKAFHGAVNEPGQRMASAFTEFRKEVQKYLLTAETVGEASAGVKLLLDADRR